MKRLSLILLTCCLLWLPNWAAAADIPPNARTYLPMLQQQQAEVWPDHPYPATIAAQIEKETCITLKHSKCWTPFAELKTKREYGFGFGQFTVAYNADGSERFNTWSDLKRQHARDLRDWNWDKRFDPRLQLRAVVLYDKQIFAMFTKATDDQLQALMFAYAGYNGGPAGTLKEIRMCAATPNCDPTRWETRRGVLGVEAVSNKSRKPWNGYGDSAFTINRKYVKAILYEKVGRYQTYYEE